MVGNDGRHPGGMKQGHLFDRRYPVIHGDHEIGVSLQQRLRRGGGQSVAVVEPAGNEDIQVLAARVAQELPQQCAGRDTVHIVVAGNDDPAVRCKGAHDQGHRLFHALEQKGIVQVLQSGLKEAPGFFKRRYASTL